MARTNTFEQKANNKLQNLFCFGYYENETKSLALMAAASHAFWRGYSRQQDRSSLKKIFFMLPKNNTTVHNSFRFLFKTNF